MGQIDVVHSVFLLPPNNNPVLPVAWTLIHEVYFYFILAFIFLLSTRLRFLISLSWVTILLLINGLLDVPNFDGNHTLQLIFSPFSLEFFAGLMLGLKFEKLPIWGRPLCYMSLALAFILLGFAHFLLPGTSPYPNNNSLLRAVWLGTSSVLILLAVVQLERGGYLLFPPILSYLGDCSYAVYLIHAPVIVACYQILATLNPSPPFSLLMSLNLAIIFATLVCGHLLYTFFEKPLINYTKKIGKQFFQNST